MTAIDDCVNANETYVAGFGGPPDKLPSRKLTVVTCMDTRLDLLPALGLAIGEAHILRNAGGLITDDVLRSLAISQRALGTTEVAIILHTQCGMQGFDDDAFRYTLMSETSSFPHWNVPGFADPHERARDSAQKVRDCAYLPHRDAVRAFVFDVTSGAITEVR